MSVSIDLAYTSTDAKVHGVLCHVVANLKDNQILHSTNFKCDYWTGSKSRVIIDIRVGNQHTKALKITDNFKTSFSKTIILKQLSHETSFLPYQLFSFWPATGKCCAE